MHFYAGQEQNEIQLQCPVHFSFQLPLLQTGLLLHVSFESTVGLIFTSVTNLLPFTTTIVQFTCNIQGPHILYSAIGGVIALTASHAKILHVFARQDY